MGAAVILRIRLGGDAEVGGSSLRRSEMFIELRSK